jgi:glucosamine--fructose-6-phosphate aminotransferase (isomerizing)
MEEGDPMCGIFGYIGYREAQALVIEGLSTLAYRGYDSAGVAVINEDGCLAIHKTPGKIQNLITVASRQPLPGTVGIGHTRWATHGKPNEANSHPHLDGSGKIGVVHNGIVENYAELKADLLTNGHVFTSETDTEVIPHLIQDLVETGHPFSEAVRIAAGRLRGAHAIACLSTDAPEEIIALRIGYAGGVAIGHGEGEMFLASDLPSLLAHTTSITTLEPGELAIINPTGCNVMTLSGKHIDSSHMTVPVNPLSAAKGGHKYFMLKEIMEQPEAAVNVLRSKLSFDPGQVELNLPFSDKEIADIQRVVFVGMGSTSYACQVGAQFVERFARTPATAENAAEFRYRAPVLDRNTLVVAVAQSGETADTLEAMNEAAARGARILSITNVEGSQAHRMAEGSVLMHAGPEIGVASSKTFINSMVAMQILAIQLGATRGTLTSQTSAELVEALSRLPALLAETIELNQRLPAEIAAKYARSRSFLFIGRGILEPIAREGAMKLKEISYIHAEGMSAAEIKHGPIALIDAETPVVALAPRDELYEKILSNIAQVKSRSGKVIGITTVDNPGFNDVVDDVLWIPVTPRSLLPMVAVVPAQLLAYHTADLLGHDVDQTRNLAKSVVVE